MSAGSISRGALLVALSLGCDRLAADPPPPASRHEIPAAPPAALGAHAASNPRAGLGLELHFPSPGAPQSEDEEQAVPGPDAGSDAAASTPEPEGVSL